MSIFSRTKSKKICQGYGFLSFTRKYKKQLLDTRVDTVKIVSTNVVHKADEFLGNKLPDAITKSNYDKIVKTDKNLRNVEEIIIQLVKRDEILNRLGKVL